jgi:hypothetical protein
MEKTMLEILKETADYYSADPNRRSFGLYNSPNSNHCAIGRCLLPELQEKGTDLLGNESDPLTFAYLNGLEDFNLALSPEYRGHTPLFWQDLQNFHDFESYWNSKGLSEKGKQMLGSIFEKIKAGYYD